MGRYLSKYLERSSDSIYQTEACNELDNLLLVRHYANSYLLKLPNPQNINLHYYMRLKTQIF